MATSKEWQDAWDTRQRASLAGLLLVTPAARARKVRSLDNKTRYWQEQLAAATARGNMRGIQYAKERLERLEAERTLMADGLKANEYLRTKAPTNAVV